MFRLFKAALLGVTLSFISSAYAQEPINIKIGWGSMPTHLIPILYENKEVLRHYGKSYTVEPIRFGGSSPQITALATGEVDMAILAPSTAVLGILNADLDLRVVADAVQDGKPGYYSQSVFVKADSGINTVQDLKGKTLAVNAVGSGLDNAVRVMLIKSGLNPETDVKIIEASFANSLPMLEEGKIDAGVIQQPFGDRLVEEGKYRRLFTSLDAIGHTQFVFLVSRASYLEKNREKLMDFFEDHIRAVRWLMAPENRDAVLPIIAKASARPVEDIAYMFTEGDIYRDPFGFPNLEGLQLAIDVSAEMKSIPQAIKISPDYVDLSFIEEAKRRIEANP